MSLLLAQTDLADLGVGDHTHDLAELLDALQLGVDVGGRTLSVLLSVLGESLPLGSVPVDLINIRKLLVVKSSYLNLLYCKKVVL